jgi:hypothetical protein
MLVLSRDKKSGDEFVSFAGAAEGQRNSVLSSRSLEQQLETAAFLEANSKRAISYTSVETSKAYARNLLRWLVLAKLQKSVDIRWSALRGFGEKWMSLPALGTQELESCRKRIKSGRSLFDQNAALLYHIIGGVLLSLSGSSLDSWSRLYSKPMLTLLERIQFAHP